MGITCCKGMRDILPAEMDSWYYLENTAFRLVGAYGYKEIRTPLFEAKELYANCIGRDSGTVKDKLWTIKGQSGESWALRPDLTASTMRAYCEHHLYLDAQGPTKLFYLGPVFLHSSGRQSSNWQGHQFGVEALGTDDPAYDTEVIMMAHDLCQALGLPEVRVHINTLGCSHCRGAYQQMLSEFFSRHSSELCDTCRSRSKNKPLWVLGCHEDKCRDLAAIVPSIHSCLCEECESHFKAVCNYLSELKIDYVVDPLIVRDVDSYNRTIFQVACADRLVAFGGRYDGMASRIAGNDSEVASLAAVGCSIDVEPLLNLMDEMRIEVGKFSPAPKVCFVGDGQDAVKLMMPVVYALRRNGIATELITREIPVDNRLADVSLARFVVGLTSDSVRARNVHMFDGEIGRVEHMSLDEALTIIGRELGLKDLPAELRPMDVRHWSIATRSHHTLDGNTRSRRAGNEPKTRSRSRRSGLKAEPVLPSSMRESRGRKGNAYALPAATREKSVSSRVRKRRRPETEDSLETAVLEPMDVFSPSVYAEPLLLPSRRDKREVELPKSTKSSRRSRSENGSRERGSERISLGRSDRLSFSEVESLVYGRSGGRKHGRGALDSDLRSLSFESVATASDRIVYRNAEDDFDDESEIVNKRGKRHTRSSKEDHLDSYAEEYHSKADRDSYEDDGYDEPYRGEKNSEKRPNIIQNINRWASERYGIEDDFETGRLSDTKNFGVRKNSARSSRSGRKSLARSRELKALVAEAAPECSSEPLDYQAMPADENLMTSASREAECIEDLRVEDGVAEVETAAVPARKSSSRRQRSTLSRRSAKAKAAGENNEGESASYEENHGSEATVEQSAAVSDSAESAGTVSEDNRPETSETAGKTRRRPSGSKRASSGRSSQSRRASKKTSSEDANESAAVDSPSIAPAPEVSEAE